MERPKIENAPGLIWRKLTTGWQARWQARHDLVKRGFVPASIHLWSGTELTDADRLAISDRCQGLQSEMLVWGRGGLPLSATYDGSLKSLAHCYLTDPDSSYRKTRYRTKGFYSYLCGRITDQHGDVLVAEINMRQVLRWHGEWGADGKVAMGHGMVGMLRGILTYGSTILDCEECRKVRALLHDMRFAMPKPRTERLTAEQAVAIRAKAREMGYYSIALAQALQFELMLRQKDVIGEWVPQSEPGHSETTYRHLKWLRGVRWSEIDADLVLRHTTSKRGKDIEVDLNLAPMVMEELGRLDIMPKFGPVIVSETTMRPYVTQEFQRLWRIVANEAGIPRSVRNMDSRAGAISEATDAGADLEHVRHAATHSDIGMTQRYSRSSKDKVRGVMEKRVKHRNEQ